MERLRSEAIMAIGHLLGRAVYLAQLEAVSEWVPIAGAKLGCVRLISDDDEAALPKFDRYVSPEGRAVYLETALMGAADCLVTGDRDLLEMSPFQNIPILLPTGFPDLRTVR